MSAPLLPTAADLHAAVVRLAAALRARHAPGTPLLLLGIAQGGIPVSRRLAAELADPAVKVGVIDISFHRDDIGRNPIPAALPPTHIPGDVHGAHVVLVDDVLFSGRTLKAALDELFDHGRPARVELATLIDRGGRRLPFAADYVGLSLPLADDQKLHVTLHDADPSQDSARLTALRPAAV